MKIFNCGCIRYVFVIKSIDLFHQSACDVINIYFLGITTVKLSRFTARLNSHLGDLAGGHRLVPNSRSLTTRTISSNSPPGVRRHHWPWPSKRGSDFGVGLSSFGHKSCGVTDLDRERTRRSQTFVLRKLYNYVADSKNKRNQMKLNRFRNVGVVK